jgi:hypothetical protein
MNTSEQIVLQWLEHVIQWLNKDEQSTLSDPATLLLEKLESKRKRNELKTALNIIDDLKLLIEKCDTNEGAEIRLRCALIAAQMGLFKDALMLCLEASTKYVKGHNYGVAQWMTGCIQWLLPGKEIEAISSWRNSLKAFELLRTASKSQKEIYAWYTDRSMNMVKALHFATKKYGIPPLPPYDQTETSDQDADDEIETNPTTEREDGTDVEIHWLEIFPVYEHIKAGDFGSSQILLEPVSGIEVNRVFIDGCPYRIQNLNSNKVLNIRSISNSIVIKVAGDSMNKAEILNGDYILLRLLPKNASDFDITGVLPEDEDFYTDAKHSQIVKGGDIVAAEILKEDNNIVLKRIFRRGNKIILQPESTDPKYQAREFDGMNIGFFVCGVAIAVLKPIDATS